MNACIQHAESLTQTAQIITISAVLNIVCWLALDL